MATDAATSSTTSSAKDKIVVSEVRFQNFFALLLSFVSRSSTFPRNVSERQSGTFLSLQVPEDLRQALLMAAKCFYSPEQVRNDALFSCRPEKNR